MELLNALKNLEKIISEDFYKRLLEGKIDDAKNTGNYVISLISDIIKDLDKLIEAAELNTNSLSDAKNELQKKTIEFKSLIEREFKDVDEKTFSEDPAVWKELLEDIFRKPTEQLLLSVDEIYTIINKSDVKEENEPIYTKGYLKIKSKTAYFDNADIIKKVEKKIRQRLFLGDFSNPDITGEIKSGSWKKFRHAHLPMPLGDHRIVYLWNGKKLVFYTIGTHKELGIS